MANLTEEVLALVRSSAKKYPKAQSALETDILPDDDAKKKQPSKKKMKKAGEEEPENPKKKPKANKSILELVEDGTRTKAIEYVKAERKKAGLPENVKDEIAAIEDKMATKELSKGGSINSDIDKYLDTQTFSHKIVTANWAERIARELKCWVDKPYPPENPPIKITEFFREAGIYHRDFYRIAKKYEILQQALDYALQTLGDIRERYVLENRWNASAGMYMMGLYDEEWRKEIQRREAAKLKQAEATGTDVKALFLEMTKPVASTEEVRKKLAEDPSNTLGPTKK